MRRAINENPVVQAALIGVMVLAFAFLLFTRVLGGGSEPAEEPAATTPATGTEAAAATTTPATPDTGAAPETAAPEAAVPGAAPAPGVAGGAPTGEFVPGKGLPRNVVEAYRDGKVIALLIVRACGVGPVAGNGGGGPCKGRWSAAGTDDKSVKVWTEILRNYPKAGKNGTELRVFVTAAKDIARYSQITNGLNVSRVPALIVIQPKRISGDVPKASVSYGFRGPAGVLQAIRDALYKGGKVPYYPE
jgi:hypothetical protein